ncbi:MAG: tannase/feruloyl esterase family alpha/beta hydrolase [Desulfuromonadales bacterium]|nr:tannase/feruloyl esterase family alpha/beta hydrolase [Desulfuromonadales bacterium]
MKSVPLLSFALLSAAFALGPFSPALAASPLASADLGSVKPQIDCTALMRTSLDGVATTAVTIVSASVTDTMVGQFCKVTGTIAPTINFEVHLPLSKWTQRYLQSGCGGLCGSTSVSFDQASSCAPALNGEFVVAATDMGTATKRGEPIGSFATDPQKRIDFAYRSNHETALVAKALIRTFYGQGPRYSYFTGCSDGGREAMIEAQRFPDDFDGVSAGAPAMNFQVQNSFYHAWVIAANRRPDGTPILLADKLELLHSAVIAHCDKLDGITDGLLSDPRACKVETKWIACAKGTRDSKKCLTPAESQVVRRIYDGPRDAMGKSYLVGGPLPGSELQWDFIPASANARAMSAMLGEAMRRYVIFPQSPAHDALVNNFKFDDKTFAAVSELHSLNDAMDPDLSSFSQHGGKLILWHGWSDTSISPMTSIAYYKAVQQQMGAEQTDLFLRLFMLPGTGHCGGGDGFAQIDTLTPLMAWAEKGHAPRQLVAGKIPDRDKAPRGGLPGGDMSGKRVPLSAAAQKESATRPVYPFPIIPRPIRAGDTTGTSGFAAGHSTAKEPNVVDWHGSSLFAPGFQRNYSVRDGALFILQNR